MGEVRKGVKATENRGRKGENDTKMIKKALRNLITLYLTKISIIHIIICI